jgi:hypothetical protein
MVQLANGLRDLREGAPPTGGEPDGRPPALLALSGVLRALMAFDDTYEHELPSIFRETAADSRLVTAVHKGTFLRVAEHMRMPSAYFLLPHTIAVHNEAMLHAALESATASGIATEIDEPSRPRAAAPLDRARRATTAALNQAIDAATIHYPNLRDLYLRAAASRGLDGLEARARGYADELRVESDAIRSRQQALANLAIATIALVFGALQVTEVVPWYVGIPVALALIGAWVARGPELAQWLGEARASLARAVRRPRG